ncbi:MAG: hypothetical protein MJ218_00760 [Opitutales bacterium]|nr:hypothetical protein [Opitutales bacterium]
MELYKKLLFVSGLCLANFYAFADAESEYDDLEAISENSFSEVEDTESSCWLAEYPTYLDLNIGLGFGNKFNYAKNAEELKLTGGSPKAKVITGPMGLEIGKIINEWRFGVEAIFIYGKTGNFELKINGKEYVIKNTIWGGSLMGNVYYDIPLHTHIAWYMGGGLGFDYLKIKMKKEELGLHGKSFWAPVCQFRIGLAFYYESYIMSAGYRIRHIFQNLKIDNSIKYYTDKKLNSEWKSPTIHVLECAFAWTF